MTIVRSLLLAAAIACATIGPVLAAPREEAQVQAADQRGQLIYDYDQAAWHSTDAMVATLPRTRLREIRGWVVEPDGDALAVLYYGYEDERPYGVFSARVKGEQVLSSREIAPTDARDLSPTQQRMAAARKVAMTTRVTACTPAVFNAVIVPPVSETAPVEVYLLSAQVESRVYPFGGHYLVTVGADGRVVKTRPFMKSCLNNPLPPDSVASMITHLLDPTPTEIHAWLARWTGKPVYVMTGEQLWAVSADGIRKVDQP